MGGECVVDGVDGAGGACVVGAVGGECVAGVTDGAADFRGGGGGAVNVRAGAFASGAIASGGAAAVGRAIFGGGGASTCVGRTAGAAPSTIAREPRTITRTPPTSCSCPISTAVDFSVAKSTQCTWPSAKVYWQANGRAPRA